MSSTDDPVENIATLTTMVDAAVVGGAEFVLTPEVTNCLSASRTHQRDVLRPEDQDQTLAAARSLAAKHGIWLLLGSIAVKANDPQGRFANRSILLGPQGEIAARYDKIHMFDVQVTEAETYRESAGYRPGDRAVIAPTSFGTLGLTICYDLRFPCLFRDLAQAGAGIITVPSAFSPATGPAHWEPLLRARAIETGAYILAPAQTGTHQTRRGRQRSSFGHSLAVSPWGEVLVDARTKPGVSFVTLDPDAIVQARQKIPSVTRDAPYSAPQ